MNNLFEALKKYIMLVQREEYLEFRNAFANKIETAIADNYQQAEPEIVRKIVNEVNKVNGISLSKDGITISTSSFYFHGSKSQVKFKYYGKESKKELGDIIFILSVIFKGEKYYEKCSIAQVKKASPNKPQISWNIDKEQLYLLSKFPTFEGVKGLVPKEKFSLPNYSGDLGSYNFVFQPGDFIYASASLLEGLIKSTKSLSLSKLIRLNEYACGPCLLHNAFNNEDIFYFFDKYYGCFKKKYSGHSMSCRFCFFGCKGILGFCHFSKDIYDFIDKYLRGCIGEPVFFYKGFYNLNANSFLKKMFGEINKWATNIGDQRAKEFVLQLKKCPGEEDFLGDVAKKENNGGYEGSKNNDSREKEGGFGIIYTSIDLGES